MKFRFLLAVLLILLSAGCYSHTIKQTYTIGKIYRDSIEFKGMSVPLPEGEWKIVGRGMVGGSFFDELVLLEVKDGKPSKALSLVRDTPHNNYTGYFTDKYLQRTNMLFTDVASNSMTKSIDGWSINHIRPGYAEGDDEAVKEAYDYMIDNKLVLPGNFIEARHVITGKRIKRRYLSYAYLVNPEVEGFKAPVNAEWASSDWNILKINGDPEKVAYIERFKKENADLHEKLRQAFDY